MDQQRLADQLMELATMGLKMSNPHGTLTLLTRIIPTDNVRLEEIRKGLVCALKEGQLVHVPTFFPAIVLTNGHEINWLIYEKLLGQYNNMVCT
ncbi:MAG: hypothetical protein V4697_00015 [Patescibacteria group bacterium]